MADTAASTTSRSSGPATTKRRARAASSNENERSARAAIALEPDEPAQAVLDADRESPEKVDGHRPEVFAGDDAQERVLDTPQPPSVDPRQGTLLGFDLPAQELVATNDEAGAATSEGEQIKPSVSPAASEMPVVAEVPAVAEAAPARVDESALQLTQPSSQQSATSTEAVTQPDISPQRVAPAEPSRATNTATSNSRRQAAAVQVPEFTLRPEPVTDALSAAVFADAMAAVHRTLADERREAMKRAARTNRMLSITMVALILTVLLGLAQAVALRRVAHESAADQQRLESLLVKQQAALVAVADAASSAAAAAREPANAAAAAAAAPAAESAPKPAPSAEPPRAAHARHSHAHSHKSKAKEKASTAN